MIMPVQRNLRTPAKPKTALSAQHPSKPRKTAGTRKPRQISRTHRPPDMSLAEWQVALRRQFAETQKYDVKNIGRESVFSEFEVTNPATHRTYRVAIRGRGLGENYCSCPDYAVNTLGTCKHIEYMLATLGRNARGRTALARGFHPPYSEVYLRYGAKREVVFRPGTECPESFR
ncbi:MAG: SWIM zinc finger domain-containing protein, partial [Planctomycetes bacterium]|nr:SWIM zinc finger domain-containing protein [Planctomycetota bacterium]